MRQAVALSLLAAALLTGCGGDDGPPSASEWADDLCTALGDWTSSITSAAESVTPGAVAGVARSGRGRRGGGDPDSSSTTSRAWRRPDLEAGQQAEQSVDELSDSLNAEVEKVKETAEGASLGNISETVSAISASFAAMSEQISTAFTELEGLDPGGELRTAFEEADSCSELQTS